jgi:hypothetical protein
MQPAEQSWPPHGQESQRWAQTHRGGTRDDPTLRSIVVSLPPFIADRTVVLDSETAADLEAATSEIAKLDSSHADDLSALGKLLLRTESVASSKIEQIQAKVDDYARALPRGHIVRSTWIAAAESRITAQRLHEIPSQWRELTGLVRCGSAAAKILALLPDAPILSSDDAVALIDAPRID